MSDNNTPGWQPDPTGKHDHRYWDGTQWTENVSDAGVASTDPYDPSAAEGPGEATLADAPAAGPSGWEPTAVTPTPPPPEATAAWPAAPAPGPGGPPPPYTPYTAQGPGGGPGGGSGSKRGLLVGGAILAAVAIAVAAFLLLSGDDESLRSELASFIEDEYDLSGSKADCAADYFVDERGEEAFEDIDFDARDARFEFEEAIGDTGPGALEKCDIDPSQLGGETPTTETTEGPTDGEPDSYGDDPVLDELYDDCDDGDFEACDKLFNQSPAGSEYEEFGDTCGERNPPSGYCVDIYDDGDIGGEGGSYGDDPVLDELYDECEAGDFAACDQLFMDSPADSEYEEFGDTCGERNEPSGFCVSLYGDE